MEAELSHVVEAFTGYINTQTLLELARQFSTTFSDLAKNSTEHFLTTPVTNLPTGREKGKFISIDVGGSNLRVGFIELTGSEKASEENGYQRSCTVGENIFARVKRSHDKSWPIEEHLKMDKAEDLFSWIGHCIAEVVRAACEEQALSQNATHSLSEEILLGVTFSFPMSQKSLSEATLLPMGKGFGLAKNLDLGKMLTSGYAKHSHVNNSRTSLPRIKVVAITNDTVATFVSLAYAVKSASNSRVAMGLIVGTGVNATVPMKPSVLHITKQQELSNIEDVSTAIINTEWSIRGTDKPLNNLKIKTTWDLQLDAKCDVPGFQPLEYMTSGRYLGEIVRLAFVDITSKVDGTEIPMSLCERNTLPTHFLSQVVARKGGRIVQQELEKGYPAEGFWTVERVEAIRDIAEAVQKRSSALIAAASVGLLHCVGDIELHNPAQSVPSERFHTLSDDQIEKEELVIAYAGGIIAQYPKWLQSCQQWIDILVANGSRANTSKTVTLKEALDGGIIGAGVLAATTTLAA